MTRTSTRSLCASAAISAALALGSNPLLAQEAAPTLELPGTLEAPPPAAAAPAEPAVTLPPAETAPPATAAAPVQQTARPAPRIELPPELVGAPAVDNTSARAEQPRRPAASTAKESRPITAERTPSREDAPVEPAGPALAAAEPAPAGAAVPATEQETAAGAVSARNVGGDAGDERGVPDEAILALAGLLAAGGVAGFLAARPARRRKDEFDEASAPRAVEAGIVPEDDPATSIPEALAVPLDAEPATRPEGRAPRPARIEDETFVMPVGPVPWGKARGNLIRRMIAAPPDAANPFTSTKARRRRARIILQSREASLREESQRPFDWRTYTPSADRPGTERPAAVEVS